MTKLRVIIAATLATAVVGIASGCAATTTTSANGNSSSTATDKGSTTGKPKYTVAQANAIKSAEQYLSLGSGFSRAGLIRQLTSSAGSGYKKHDAVFAVNHIKVDWKQQAVLAAKGYMKMTGFSRAGLIQQLTSSAGSGFTNAQAQYAANKVGL